MRLEEILVENCSMTCVSSIGRVYYNSFTDHIKLYRQEPESLVHIANIKRRKFRGWNFEPTKGWKVLGLPHLGHANSTKTRGIKTHNKSLKDILRMWGVKYDSLESLN